MREFNCVVCGKKTIDKTTLGNGKCCSKECRLVYARAKLGHGDIPCKFNEGVLCGVQQCENCGWNPEVEARRKEAIYGKEQLPSAASGDSAGLL